MPSPLPTLAPTTTRTQQQKLEASDAAANDAFGFSVSVSGDTAIVGAHIDDTTGGSNAGSAYVFVRSGTTWTQQQKLEADDDAANDLFGTSVSISEDTAIVGAILNDTTAGGSAAGSAYVFVRGGTTWTQQQKLEANDAASGDQFGISVSISRDMAIVGAHQDVTIAGGTTPALHTSLFAAAPRGRSSGSWRPTMLRVTTYWLFCKRLWGHSHRGGIPRRHRRRGQRRLCVRLLVGTCNDTYTNA